MPTTRVVAGARVAGDRDRVADLEVLVVGGVSSIATSPAAAGFSPSTSVSASNSSFSVTDRAMWGGPPDGGPIRSPSSPRIEMRVSATTPSAILDPLDPLDAVQDPPRRSPPRAPGRTDPRPASRSRTVTSMPALTSPKRLSNDRLTDSPIRSVPDTIATPKNTDEAVEIARNFRAKRLRIARPSIAVARRSA